MMKSVERERSKEIHGEFRVVVHARAVERELQHPGPLATSGYGAHLPLLDHGAIQITERGLYSVPSWVHCVAKGRNHCCPLPPLAP